MADEPLPAPVAGPCRSGAGGDPRPTAAGPARLEAATRPAPAAGRPSRRTPQETA
ncbi:hypothetical protein [Streptomyces sp. enrichment culture]|uniref:hypothetical protein n=1 Tax=Streptomyces sp. enrichment culture TaxID=1795815 RepID=UPI003F5518B3